MIAAVYLGAMIASSIGYAFALLATTAGESSEPRTASVPPGLREILGTSTAMGLRSAASVLFVSSSLWVLSWARPHEEVAVYGVAVTLLQVMAAIPSIANFVVPQEFALMYADGRRSEMEQLARTAATLVAILSGSCLLGLLLVGRPLIRAAYGDAYVGASTWPWSSPRAACSACAPSSTPSPPSGGAPWRWSGRASSSPKRDD